MPTTIKAIIPLTDKTGTLTIGSGNTNSNPRGLINLLFEGTRLIIRIIIIINMTKVIKLFLPNEFYEEVLYQYEGKDGDLRKLVHSFLTPLGKQGKMVRLNGSTQIRVMENGKPTMVEKDVRDLDLEKTAVKSDGDWIPTKVTKEEIKVYNLTISDRLHEDIVDFGKVFCARLSLYNESLSKEEKADKEKVAILPACLEQIIQDNVIGRLSQAVAANIDKDYDEEFAELEKKIEDKKSPKRKGSKKE